MYPDQIPSERLPRESSSPLPFHATDGSAGRGLPLPATPHPNTPLPDSTDNPEFTKWWGRWMSRVRQTARKIPASRRLQIGRNNKDKSSPENKVAQATGADTVSAASARESAGARESGRERESVRERESAKERESGRERETSDGITGERLNRTDRGEVRHRNNRPSATRAISGEAEFKRYLL